MNNLGHSQPGPLTKPYRPKVLQVAACSLQLEKPWIFSRKLFGQQPNWPVPINIRPSYIPSVSVVRIVAIATTKRIIDETYAYCCDNVIEIKRRVSIACRKSTKKSFGRVLAISDCLSI